MSNVGDRRILKARRRVNEDVNRMELSLVESSNGEDVRKKRFRFSDTLRFLDNMMKAEFNINQDAEARIWRKGHFDPNSLTLLNDLDKTLEDLWLLSGQQLIIEVKNDDGTWPKDVRYHKRERNPLPQGCENQSYTSAEKFKIFHGEIEEMQVKASNMKRELETLNHELNNMNEEQKRGKKRNRDQETELEKIKKQQKTLDERRKVLEADVRSFQTTDITLRQKIGLSERKRQKITEEVRVLDDNLQEYAKTTKDILDKIEPEPKKDEKGGLIEFMAKAIKEKEEMLTCPVCLEVAEAPIYTCQQMHLICSGCRPRLAACPECRERYRLRQIKWHTITIKINWF